MKGRIRVRIWLLQIVRRRHAKLYLYCFSTLIPPTIAVIEISVYFRIT